MTDNHDEPAREGSDPRLDEWIRSWEGRSRSPEDRVTRLEARICSAIREDRDLRALRQVIQVRRSRVRYASAGGIAALFLVALGITFQFYFQHRPSREVGGSMAGSTEISSSLFAEYSPPASADRLFSEMQRLFPGQLNWIAESGSAVEVGLADLESGSPAMETSRWSAEGKDAVVAVRWLVRIRAPGESDWKRVWRLRVLARPEEMVTFDVDARHEASSGVSRISAWAMPLEDGKVAVDALIESQDWLGERLASNLIQSPGEAACLAKGVSPAGEYEVYQLVEMFRVPRGEKSSSGVSTKEEA